MISASEDLESPTGTNVLMLAGLLVIGSILFALFVWPGYGANPGLSPKDMSAQSASAHSL